MSQDVSRLLIRTEYIFGTDLQLQHHSLIVVSKGIYWRMKETFMCLDRINYADTS